MLTSSHADGDKKVGVDSNDDKLTSDRKHMDSSLAKQPWYWPYTTRDESERRLAGKADGTFLIRDCSVPGDFTLTVREAGGNKCVRIYKHQKGYSLSPTEPEAPFSSLPDLVEFYHCHSLASFNKRLDVCLSYPLAKPASAGSNQYGVFKELYDLSQDQLSAQTRLTVLHQQHSQFDQKVKLFEMTIPALRVVQQMYYDSMKLQEEWGPIAPTLVPTAVDSTELLGDLEETERLSMHVFDNPDGHGEEDKYKMSKAEEKSFTVNTHMLMSRHTTMSEKLHTFRSNYDAELVKLRELEAELQHVELTLLRMKRRQEELIRQMVDMGCQKEFLCQVLELRVATREFDRSTWLVDCTRDEAVARLEGLPHGAFLIRHKDKRRLPYVLSIVMSGDSGPRIVQHSYIVRPHGRGYGFNPALAVFESIDQLVLRHRYVSLKHYFKSLDVMLTFPVGCQELLRRSASESDKESVKVKEGEYANASAILQQSMMDNVYEIVGCLSEGDEQSGDSSELQDSLKGDMISSGTVENIQSGSTTTHVKENEYECVEFSGKNSAPTVAVGLSKVVREHTYEVVDALDKIFDSKNTSDHQEVRTDSKYETIGRSEKSIDSTSTRECSEMKREPISASDKNTDSTEARESQDLDRESKYETIGRVEFGSGKDQQDFVRKSKYETIGSSEKSIDSSSTRDCQEMKKAPVDTSEKNVNYICKNDHQNVEKESESEAISRSDSDSAKDKKDVEEEFEYETIGRPERNAGSSNMEGKQYTEMKPKCEHAGTSQKNTDSSNTECKEDANREPKYENIGASERSIDSSKTKDDQKAKEPKSASDELSEDHDDSSNNGVPQKVMMEPKHESVGLLQTNVEASEVTVKNDESPEISVKSEKSSEVSVKSDESSEISVKSDESLEISVKSDESSEISVKSDESSAISTSFVSKQVRKFERLSEINTVKPDCSFEALEISEKSTESSKISASCGSVNVQKYEQLSAAKTGEPTSSASLPVLKSVEAADSDKYESLSTLKSVRPASGVGCQDEDQSQEENPYEHVEVLSRSRQTTV